MPTALYPCLAGVNYESLVDGEGVRAAIFLSGCSHRCPGCQNPEAQNPSFGTQITDKTIDRIAKEVTRRPFLSGITLTGGDPFFNACASALFLLRLLAQIPSYLTVWLYTGYTFEKLVSLLEYPPWGSQASPVQHGVKALLISADVLVDGRYDQSLADKTLPFRGSSNQRFVDLNASFNSHTGVCSSAPVLWKGASQ